MNHVYHAYNLDLEGKYRAGNGLYLLASNEKEAKLKFMHKVGRDPTEGNMNFVDVYRVGNVSKCWALAKAINKGWEAEEKLRKL